MGSFLSTEVAPNSYGSSVGRWTAAPGCEFSRCHSLCRALTFLWRDGARHCAIGTPCPCAVTMAIVMVVSNGLFDGRAPNATSNGRIRPEGRLRLDRLPATARPAFFPCREVAAFLAGQKSRLTPSFAALRA